MVEAVSESPVVKLTNAILLSALKKGAKGIRIQAATDTECVVEFRIGDDVHEELRPPATLLGPIVRRLSVMGSLPVYPKHGSASGRFQLVIGDKSTASFAIRVEGHGTTLAVLLELVSD